MGLGMPQIWMIAWREGEGLDLVLAGLSIFAMRKDEFIGEKYFAREDNTSIEVEMGFEGLRRKSNLAILSQVFL